VGSIPVLKPREVVATTVPFHSNRDISPILLRQIAKDIGLTVDAILVHR
jgi:predicted RNA binding protein YcfA (HicA-like mRNA interferase family)